MKSFVRFIIIQFAITISTLQNSAPYHAPLTEVWDPFKIAFRSKRSHNNYKNSDETRAYSIHEVLPFLLDWMYREAHFFPDVKVVNLQKGTTKGKEKRARGGGR